MALSDIVGWLKKVLMRPNKPQRLGLFIGFASSLFVLFLHNPIDGYEPISYTPTYYSCDDAVYSSNLSCGAPNDECKYLYAEANRLYKANDNSWEKYDNDPRKKAVTEGFAKYRCLEDYLAPFKDWRTEKPHIEWLGSVLHVIFTLLFIGTLSISWCFINDDRP
jgi:hypothetical protein